MKILIFSEHFIPSKGGSIKWLVNIYKNFSKNKVEFAAGTCAGDAEADAQFPLNVTRIYMTMADWDPTVPKSFSRYFVITKEILRLCRTHNITQIHCAKVFPEGLITLIVSKLKNIPYVLYSAGEEITEGFTSRKLGMVIPFICRGASKIIVCSTNTKHIIHNLGIPDEKIHIVYPGVNVARFADAEEKGNVIRKKHDLQDAPVILTVGRLQLRKGHDTVIKALPAVKKRFKNIRYLIAGIGEEENYLKGLVREVGGEEHVIFAELVPDDELPGYYGACDLFIMANRQVNEDIEGFGIVFLEAAAAKKAVIAGKSGGTADAVAHNITGLLIDASQIDETADTIISLLTDIARRERMGNAGYERVQQDFAIDRAGKQVKAISEQIEKYTNAN